MTVLRIDPMDPQGTRPLATYRGSCHCGAVAFEIETDFPELTMCDCSICRRKNALMVKVPESRFRLVAGADALDRISIPHEDGAALFLRGRAASIRSIASGSRPITTASTYFASHDFDPAGIPVRQAVGAAMA